MIKCMYCGQSPYATYCPSFERHVEMCKIAFEKGKGCKKIPRVKDPISSSSYVYINQAPIVINCTSYTFHNINLQLLPQERDVMDTQISNYIKNEDDAIYRFEGMIEHATEVNNSYLRKCLTSSDLSVRKESRIYAKKLLDMIGNLYRQKVDGKLCGEIYKRLEEYKKSLDEDDVPIILIGSTKDLVEDSGSVRKMIKGPLEQSGVNYMAIVEDV